MHGATIIFKVKSFHSQHACVIWLLNKEELRVLYSSQDVNIQPSNEEG